MSRVLGRKEENSKIFQLLTQLEVNGAGKIGQARISRIELKRYKNRIHISLN